MANQSWPSFFRQPQLIHGSGIPMSTEVILKSRRRGDALLPHSIVPLSSRMVSCLKNMTGLSMSVVVGVSNKTWVRPD